MNLELFQRVTDAFGPSGFEEDVVRALAPFCEGLVLETDAMNNLIARYPQNGEDNRPVVMLDAHLDECGLMVQTICDNGLLGILMLGGMHLSTLPAHSVWVRTRSGKKLRGIITAKPVHFMTAAERSSCDLDIEHLWVDVGVTSRSEAEKLGISVGDPIVPDVRFDYDAERELCFGKAFDNRAGCTCIVETLQRLKAERENLPVQPVGGFSAQEEIGSRGVKVTVQKIRPQLAVVFEGSPSDDFFVSPAQAQCRMGGGVQIRRIDAGYISHPRFADFAAEVARETGIPYQEAARRGGSTNAQVIHTALDAVPCLVLGIPSRYVHSSYNFCSAKDVDAAVSLTCEVLRRLTPETVDYLLHRDVL